MSNGAILEDYLELVTYGFTNPMPDADEGPWKITAKDVIDGEINFNTARKTTHEAFDTKLTKKSRPKVGDVLLTKDGTLGRLAIVKEDNLCINQSVAVLRPNEKILPEYLFYLLSTPEYQRKMIGDSDGTVIKHIYITRVGKMEVDIPSIDVQRERVKHLLALDGKVKLNRQTNQTLEQIAQAIFKSWFVDFEPTRAKIQAKKRWQAPNDTTETSSPTCYSEELDTPNPAQQQQPNLTLDQAMTQAAMAAISGKTIEEVAQLSPEQQQQLKTIADLFPDALVESEFGEIPKGWEVKPFGSVCTNLDSRRIPLSKKQREKRKGPFPYYGAAAVFDYVDDYLFEGVHVLMAEDGNTVVDKNGYATLQYVWGKFWVNNHAHVLKGRSVISEENIYLFLKSVNVTS